jgi:hypothetical protein
MDILAASSDLGKDGEHYLDNYCSICMTIYVILYITGMERQILANFDKEGIIVYQAFKPSTAEEAVRLGTFGTGFSLDRMTWIKSSFGWMLYRSGYATKQGQERILKIKLTHEGFQTILAQAIPSSFDRKLFETEKDWYLALRRGEVRYQWDPDRDLKLKTLFPHSPLPTPKHLTS